MAGPVKPSDPNRRDSNQKGGGDDKKRAPWSYLSIVMWAVMLVFLPTNLPASAFPVLALKMWATTT